MFKHHYNECCCQAAIIVEASLLLYTGYNYYIIMRPYYKVLYVKALSVIKKGCIWGIMYDVNSTVLSHEDKLAYIIRPHCDPV